MDYKITNRRVIDFIIGSLNDVYGVGRFILFLLLLRRLNMFDNLNDYKFMKAINAMRFDDKL